MKLKKIKTVSVLEFVPSHSMMMTSWSKDFLYIDTPECPMDASEKDLDFKCSNEDLRIFEYANS